MKLFSLQIASAASFALCAGACSSISQFDTSKMKAVEIVSSTASQEQWKSVESEINAGREVLFLIHKGESVPLIVKVQLPMATLGAGNNILVFTRDTYLLISRAGLQVSPDGQRWANIEDLAGQRELYGYTSGSMSMGLSASESNSVQATIDIGVK